MKKHKLGNAILAFARQKERMFEDGSFRIFTLILPFMAVSVLTIYTSLETSTRLYGVSNPLEHNSEVVERSGLWLSIGIKNDQVIIRTINGQTFSWALSGPTEEQLTPLKTYLSAAAKDIVEKSVLKGQISSNDSLVALSVDQQLNFNHIRPVIYAIAGAGFTKYGFETRVLR